MAGESFDASQILSRLRRLERQNGLMRAALCAVLVILAAGALLAANAQDASQQLDAQQIILRDDSGAPRVVLGRDLDNGEDEPHYGVFVYDEKQEGGISLLAKQGRASLDVKQEGKVRLTLGTGKERFAGLLLLASAGESEKGQMCFFYTDAGKPAFAFNDSNHKTRIMMMLDNGEKPYLMLQDQNQQAFFSQGQP